MSALLCAVAVVSACSKVPYINEPVAAEDITTTNSNLATRGLAQYLDVTRRPWLHLVDGGVSDNLGLRPLHGIFEITNSDNRLVGGFDRSETRHVLLISVNASLNYEREWSKQARIPGATQVLAAVSSIQMERYNADSVQLVNAAFDQWAAAKGAAGEQVSFHFVEVNIASMPSSMERDYLNAIPTNFNLNEEQVARLIDAARRSLRHSNSFQHFMARHTATPNHSTP